MKKLIVAAMLLLSGGALADGLPHAAPPDGPRLALMNGSLMQIVPGPHGQITVIYLRPRVGLLPLVQPGSVLLVGQWRGDHLEATVYGSHRCGFFPYPVGGSVNPDGVLTLVGQAPLIDNATCWRHRLGVECQFELGVRALATRVS